MIFNIVETHKEGRVRSCIQPVLQYTVATRRDADGWAKWAAINRHELLKRHKRGGFEGYPVRHVSRPNVCQGSSCFPQIMF